MTATETSELDLVRIASAGFSATADVEDSIKELMERWGVGTRNVVARLAIARSLSMSEPPPPTPNDERGKTIKGENLFGDDLRAWIALLVERDQRALTVSGLQDLIRRHWRRGAQLLAEEWKACDQDFNKFMKDLALRADLRAVGSSFTGGDRGESRGPVARSGPVRLPIGEISTDLSTGERIEWVLNGSGRSPHMALMGTLGTGKTRVGVTMLRAMRQQAGCPVLIFDMGKGDLANNAELARSLDAAVIEPIRTPVPLNFLHVGGDPATGAISVAMRFRESFARVPSNRMGAAQMDTLREAALRSLNGRGAVRLRDIRDQLRQIYAERKRKDDIVSSTFNDMTSWTLFEPTMNPAEFFSRSWIIDVHSAPETAQRLIVFLLLDALYTHLTLLQDSQVDAGGHRSLRVVLAIDEARKVLAFEQASLIGLVRESRSKGGAVMLISQSPDDFDQVEEDFLENIGLGVAFRTNARPTGLKRILGQDVDLGQLPDGVCVTRLPEKGLVRIQAWKKPE